MKLLFLLFALIAVSYCDEVEDRDGRGIFDCIYKCPKGKSPVRNSSFKATPNGCGPKGFKIPVSNKGFVSCCDKHDICYGTCNSNKAKCDETFKACMKSTCKKTDNLCNGAADAFFLAVMTPVGCSIYLNVQGKACTCK